MGRGLNVHVLGSLGLLIQIEAEAVFALVSHRQIGEDKVTSFFRSVQVCHSGNRHSCQDGNLGSCNWLNASSSNGTSDFQGRKEKEIRLVGEGDVLSFMVLALKDAQLNNGRGINRSTIGRGLGTRTTRPGTLWLLNASQNIGELASFLGNSLDRLRRGTAGRDGRHTGVIVGQVARRGNRRYMGSRCRLHKCFFAGHACRS